MLYGLETVALTKRQEAEIEVAELKMLRFSGTLGEIKIFKMAAKMADANLKTAITPLLINLETYFLGRIVGLAHKI